MARMLTGSHGWTSFPGSEEPCDASLYPSVGVTIHSITSQFLNQSSVANSIERFREVQDTDDVMITQTGHQE